MKRYRFVLVALLLVVGCGGGGGTGDAVVNTVVGSWTLAHVNGRSIPTVVDYNSTTQTVVVSEHLTITANGTIIDVGTYAPSGIPLAGEQWQPSGQEYTVADTGTCARVGDAASTTVTFSRTGRSGTVNTVGWTHLNVVMAGVDPLDFSRNN